MSVVDVLAGAVDWLLNSPGAPGDPGPLTGPGSVPGTVGNGPGPDSGDSGDRGDGDGGDGEGGDGEGGDGEGGDGEGGDGEKGPFDDLIEAAKKTLDWAKEDIPEIVDVMTKPDSELTEDEKIVRDAVDDPFVPIPDLSDMKSPKDAYDYADDLTDYVNEKGTAGAEGAVTIDKYNRDKTDLLDSILDSKGEVESGDDSGDSESGDSDDGGDGE